VKPSPRSLFSVALVLSSLAIASPVSAASDTTPKVTVFSGEDLPVAEFTTAKCRKARGGFTALTPTVNGYRLLVAFDAFKGFRTYDLVRGANADPYVTMMVNGEAAFSTLYEPPFPVPGFGQVRFSPKGKLMGVGFQPMFNQAGTDGVVFAGAVTCGYPKKRK
jgi:hypothetical protein